jgi:crossover junction endodeoxyribonuclease RusA
VTMTAPETTHGGITRPQSWRLALPAKTKLINANHNLHFRRKAELIKVIRNAAWTMARHSNIPALQRAHIYFVIHPDLRASRRDPGNWAPTAKAAVDGLVDAGVLPDDDSTRLLGPDPRIGDPVKGSQFVLWITDLDQMHPDHITLLNPPGALR